MRTGVSSITVVGFSRCHLVCYRGAVPQGFPAGTQLLADVPTTAPIKIHIGPTPKTGNVWAIVGLTKRNGMDVTRLQAFLNGKVLESAGDVPTTGHAGTPARALQFACPLETVVPGYNEIEFRSLGRFPAQRMVWVELHVEPK